MMGMTKRRWLGMWAAEMAVVQDEEKEEEEEEEGQGGERGVVWLKGRVRCVGTVGQGNSGGCVRDSYRHSEAGQSNFLREGEGGTRKTGAREGNKWTRVRARGASREACVR
ncbi:hypothetical protein E2C01_025627 [Portunus trituberculatus]|uniref:Uncharacterized protein n=1 Tax=Portunus trituberculatus TaxID=210409 RepID=A0A5B7EG83_PORTR|nr:hypothetical protein [Portunus trituberculatus]